MSVSTTLIDSDSPVPETLETLATSVSRPSSCSSARADQRSLSEPELGGLGEGMRLLLHGEVNFGTTPHLEGVLESVVALCPPRLTIDLSDTTGVSLEALAAIVRRGREVGSLAIDLPPSIGFTILDLISGGYRGTGRVGTNRSPG